MAKARTLIGAAYWASYFINGDDLGLTDDERKLADAWLDNELEQGELIVSCGDEPYFSWSYDLYTGAPYRGGDLLEYVVCANDPSRPSILPRAPRPHSRGLGDAPRRSQAHSEPLGDRQRRPPWLPSLGAASHPQSNRRF